MSDMLTKMPLYYEPLKNNRWIMRFPSDLGINEWTLVSASRPHIQQNSKEIQFLNTSTYVLGRYTWASINLTLRDPIGPSSSQAVMWGFHVPAHIPLQPEHAILRHDVRPVCLAASQQQPHYILLLREPATCRQQTPEYP